MQWLYTRCIDINSSYNENLIKLVSKEGYSSFSKENGIFQSETIDRLTNVNQIVSKLFKQKFGWQPEGLPEACPT